MRKRLPLFQVAGKRNARNDGKRCKGYASQDGWSADYLFFFEVGVVEMSYAAQAFYYAADNGARIASCSWGSANTGGIKDAIDYFLASGGLIFKAAGNDGLTS